MVIDIHVVEYQFITDDASSQAASLLAVQSSDWLFILQVQDLSLLILRKMLP